MKLSIATGTFLTVASCFLFLISKSILFIAKEFWSNFPHKDLHFSLKLQSSRHTKQFLFDACCRNSTALQSRTIEHSITTCLDHKQSFVQKLPLPNIVMFFIDRKAEDTWNEILDQSKKPILILKRGTCLTLL